MCTVTFTGRVAIRSEPERMLGHLLISQKEEEEESSIQCLCVGNVLGL